MRVKNANLLRKAEAAERRRKADDVLRGSHRVDPAQRIRSLSDWPDGWVGLPDPIVKGAASDAVRGPLRQLLTACARASGLVDHRSPHLHGLVALARWSRHWVRDPAGWRPASHNRDRQFAALARHLLARYPLPPVLDDAWRCAPRDDRAAEQAWFVHVGGGGNLRKAAGLPFPLTKMAAHHALEAPVELPLRSAIVWGWCRATGAGDRLASALVEAHAVAQLGDGGPAAAERLPFWESVVRMFAAHDRMLDRSRVAPIVDYIHGQKYVPAAPVAVDGTFRRLGPPQPGYCMAGRDLAGLLAATERWHRQLARSVDVAGLRWPACGIGGLDRIEGAEGSQRRFTVVELSSSASLRAEGAAMRHCVFTYARRCHEGRVAIYSLRDDHGVGAERRATVEVDVRSRRVVQVRGRLNARPGPLDERLLRAWAAQEQLTFGTYAFGLR
jgi:hypothetical protein